MAGPGRCLSLRPGRTAQLLSKFKTKLKTSAAVKQHFMDALKRLTRMEASAETGEQQLVLREG